MILMNLPPATHDGSDSIADETKDHRFLKRTKKITGAQFWNAAIVNTCDMIRR
jgi:hypothetical protein